VIKELIVSLYNKTNKIMRDETPKRTREEANEARRQHKVGSNVKFSTISEMKQQFNAINTLHNNGYDPAALRDISRQFLGSVEYAMSEVNRMKEKAHEIANNPY
jgi:hypothetical protein